MWAWLATNWLALYGAVVATAAAVWSGLGYFQKLRASKVRLQVSCEPTPRPPQPPDGYVITVTNVGAVSAPLAEAGVIDANGKKHIATRPVQAGGMARWVVAFNTTLAPHDSESANVQVKQPGQPFKAVTVFAMRKDGKEMCSRLDAKGFTHRTWWRRRR